MDANHFDSNNTVINLTATRDVVIFKPLTSEAVLWYFRMIGFGILGQAMAIMGSVTNGINIIIFLKLGVKKDAMNVSLLGLSVSDFVSCFSVIFLNLCFTPGFSENENLPFTPIGAHFMFSSWPHIIFVKITVCITAFITIERCLCVTYPLKIKQLMNPKRVAIITISLYLLNLLITAPIYHIYRMEWVFLPELNRTVYTLVFHEDRAKFEPPLVAILLVVIPFVTFFATIIATVILIYNLKKNAKWRASVTTTRTTKEAAQEKSSNATTASSQKISRDQMVAKMVAVISILYIACNLPVTITIVASLFIPGLKEGGSYQNTLYAIFSLNYLFESTNASLNIFIYYTMSTNYKTMMQKVFSLNRKKIES